MLRHVFAYSPRVCVFYGRKILTACCVGSVEPPNTVNNCLNVKEQDGGVATAAS